MSVTMRLNTRLLFNPKYFTYEFTPMALITDFSVFFDEQGNVVELTEQAKPIFKFIKEIVATVSADINAGLINTDLKCNSRAKGVSCEGHIDATHTDIGFIRWQCDTCEASGKISHWQGNMFDNQKRVLH